MTPKNLFGRNLDNSAFSIDRLVIWAVGSVLVISTIGILTLSLFEKPESRVLNNIATFSLGSFVTLITKGSKTDET